MENETMDMGFLGALFNLDDIIILMRILKEPENSLLKVLDFLGFVLWQMYILLGLKQNLQGIKEYEEMSFTSEMMKPNPFIIDN